MKRRVDSLMTENRQPESASKSAIGNGKEVRSEVNVRGEA
jgi:hypothetical protein